MPLGRAQSTGRTSMQIGFCGLGRMGAAMVARLLDQGQKPVVWNRTPDRTKPLVVKGARSAPTPAAVAAQSDIVFSMLLDEAAVRAVYDGKDGLFSGDVKGKLFIDMSTVAPTVPQKLAINLPLCIYWEALGEAIALTRDFKIPPTKMMEIFAESSGGINGLKVRGPAVVKALETGERPPGGFTIDGVIKDMNIMSDWAKHLGIELPALERVLASYRAASHAGWAQADNCSVLFYRLDEAKKAAR